MDFNQFTIKAREAIQSAQQLAAQNKNQAIEPAHLLAGMLDVDENVITYILEKQSANVTRITELLYEEIKKFPRVEGVQGMHLSNQSNQILINAQNIAKEMNDDLSLIHI